MNTQHNTEDHKTTADDDIPYCSEYVPPESFWLSNDSEYDWFDRNAFVLERKESTKGNSNVTSTSSYSRSNSQKFSVNLKSKPAIIGLPKTQRNTHVDSSRRQCKPLTVRMFPKRSGSGGRTTVTEPSSPKVSCIGRVRSKRCPSRRKSSSKPSKPSKPVKQPVVKPENQKSNKTGLIYRITSLFRSDGQRGQRRRKGSNKAVNEQLENSYSRKNSVTVKPVNSEPASPPEPPVLGGMNRYASGRRSVNWSDEIDVAGRRSSS